MKRESGAVQPLLRDIRTFLARRRRLGAAAQRLLDRFPRVQDRVVELVRGDSWERYQAWIETYDTLDGTDFAAMRATLARLSDPPLLSVVALGGTPSADSLRTQVYKRWQGEYVASWTARELNAALDTASADFVVLVDPQTVLRPHALFLLAQTVVRHPDAVLLYADGDTIDEDGVRSDHDFKPDWNPALLRAQNYFGGLVCVRRSRAIDVGGCKQEADGECEWDLCLRLTSGLSAAAIRHLPYVLWHRRRPHSRNKNHRAYGHEQRLAGIGANAEVEPVGGNSFRIRYSLPSEAPAVTVIVPSTCRLELLRTCVDGILDRTDYPKLELMVVANNLGATARARRRYLNALSQRSRAHVVFYDECPYNFSKANNWAARRASGDLFCFLNDDTAVIGSDWLSTMIGEAIQDRVAAVGAMLLYPNGRIQHAGIILGVGGVGAHSYKGQRSDLSGYNERLLVSQDVSAVTAACMLVRRDAFLAVEGFDETLPIAFNDVDLCLRLRRGGWRTVWTPSAKLYHKEGASLHVHDVEQTWQAVHGRWSDELAADPYYNPNLSLDAFELWEPAFPPRVARPWHTSCAEGAVGG